MKQGSGIGVGEVGLLSIAHKSVVSKFLYAKVSNLLCTRQKKLRLTLLSLSALFLPATDGVSQRSLCSFLYTYFRIPYARRTHLPPSLFNTLSTSASLALLLLR